MPRLRLASREQETFENAFAAHIADFRALHQDVEVTGTFRKIHDHFELMVEGEGCFDGSTDLLLCCTDWLPQVIARGGLTPLDPYLASNPPQDWPEGWHPAMRALNGDGQAVYGLPWHDGPEVLHYRKDLFEDPLERENYRTQYGRELRPPKTWSEFVDVAKFFTRPELGVWGCCEAAYTDGHNNVYDFLIQLWSRGGALWTDEFKPTFHDAIGQEALQFYYDLFHTHKVASPECLNLGSVECGDYYAAGNAAMSWNWCGFAAVAEMPEYSKIVGKNACTALPAGDGPGGLAVSLNIYWVLAIPSSSANKDLAYEFVRHIAAPHLDKITSMVGANGTRLSTWRDPEVRAKYPYYGIIEEVHAGTRTLPAIPEYPAINEAISRAVHAALHDEKSIAQALADAAREAEDILRGSGRLTTASL